MTDIESGWLEAEQLIGKTIGKHQGADSIEQGSIRRHLEAIEFNCPLHYDRDLARAAGYQDITAPNSMVMAMSLPAYWKPGDPLSQPEDPVKSPPYSIMKVPTPCEYAFATDVEIEFFEPVYVGDRISCTDELESIAHKSFSFGKGAFLTQKTVYKNQKDQIVAIMRSTLLRYNTVDEESVND